MTDPLEAARAYVAAGDALKSPEHAADVEKLRELSNRVREREAALEAAQEALFGAHQEQVQTGEYQAALNAQAARTIASPKPWVEQFLNGGNQACAEDDIFEPEQPFHTLANGLDVHESQTCRNSGIASED